MPVDPRQLSPSINAVRRQPEGIVENLHDVLNESALVDEPATFDEFIDDLIRILSNDRQMTRNRFDLDSYALCPPSHSMPAQDTLLPRQECPST